MHSCHFLNFLCLIVYFFIIFSVLIFLYSTVRFFLVLLTYILFLLIILFLRLLFIRLTLFSLLTLCLFCDTNSVLHASVLFHPINSSSYPLSRRQKCAFCIIIEWTQSCRTRTNLERTSPVNRNLWRTEVNPHCNWLSFFSWWHNYNANKRLLCQSITNVW